MAQKEWWRNCVIYQIYPRSFCDSNADGIGDLRGIISKLEYIASLGVDAIWISPFFTSPMKDFGYDISDYYDVDPIFGSLDDFRELMSFAHELKLKVLIDQVWAHTSNEHAWFKQSRMSRDSAKRDWYIWADSRSDGTPPNNWLAYFGGPAWTWDTRTEQYYASFFSSPQPALNLSNVEVRDAIKRAAGFWLDMGVDGFRVDAVQQFLPDMKLRDNPIRTAEHPPVSDIDPSNPLARQWRAYSQAQEEEILEWIAELRGFMNSYGDTTMLAEVGGDDNIAKAAKYVEGQDLFHMAYAFGPTQNTLDRHTFETQIKEILQVNNGCMCWATGSHDAVRVVSRFHRTDFSSLADRALYAMALGMSVEGSFCLYQGEELGLPEAELSFEDLRDPYGIAFYPEFKGRDGCRTPIPWFENAPHAGFSTAGKTWLPVFDNHIPLAVDQQEKDPGSVLNEYRKFLKWRKENETMRFGKMHIIDTPGPIIAYERRGAHKTILCVFNSSEHSETWHAEKYGQASLIEHASRNATFKDGHMTFEPYGYAFLNVT